MPEIAIEIKNLAQIKSAFSKAPMLMGRNLNIAIRKVTLNIQSRSMRNTPVLSGRLRASTESSFSNLKGEVGTNTNYDIFVHEGTRFMRARPYLRQAVESEQTQSDRFFTEAVDQTLKEIGDMT